MRCSSKLRLHARHCSTSTAAALAAGLCARVRMVLQRSPHLARFEVCCLHGQVLIIQGAQQAHALREVVRLHGVSSRHVCSDTCSPTEERQQGRTCVSAVAKHEHYIAWVCAAQLHNMCMPSSAAVQSCYACCLCFLDTTTPQLLTNNTLLSRAELT